MKKYFLIVIAFSFASSLNAQDNQIGGTGNVGIGTTNPGAKLEVNGNISNSIGSGGTLTLFEQYYQITSSNACYPHLPLLNKLM